MEHPQPRGLSRPRVERLLAKSRHEPSIGERIEILSGHLIGYRYQSNPLIGSIERPEIFTASLDGFDCVTYIETILALARSSDVEDFVEWLRVIRYRGGRIQWVRRNHYMTSWIRSNVRAKIIQPLSVPATPQISRQRVLDVVLGLPAERIRMKCVPKKFALRLSKSLRSGDLMFFVSTRTNLDVFHAGIIVCEREGPLLRHASRRRGAVIEQRLDGFLKENRMAGVLVVRPREMRRRSQRYRKSMRQVGT